MKYIKIILICLITIIISQFIDVSVVKNNHFNMITVNAVFIGFLFTSLSILLGFLSEKVVRFFEESGSMKKVYYNLEMGILYSISSVILSIINLTIVESYCSNSIIIKSFYGLEIMFLVITVYLLLKTLFNLKIIIDSIKINKQRYEEEKRANEELREIINKKLKK